MNVKVLTTPGCTNCNTLEKILNEMNIQYSIIDITKYPEYLKKFPIFTAPGLVINDTLAYVGIPKKQDLEKIITKFK